MPAALDRRAFLALAAAPLAGIALPALAQRKPDYSLTIGNAILDIAPGGHIMNTLAYNGTIPGPLIRVREGQQVTIEVKNTMCGMGDIVHWHGLHVPVAVDGAREEGDRMLMGGQTASYTFVAQPAGTRWYHTHAMARTDLMRSLYTGQFGFFYIEPKDEPGRFDQEQFIALRHWEPSWVVLQDLRHGPPADNGLEVGYMSASFNARALAFGDPIKVKRGQRVMFRLLNASATMDATVALSGHRFTVLTMDGNPVPVPQTLDALYLAPGERIDALVTMDNPGVWVFGSTQDAMRKMGMGAIVEYAGAGGEPVWQPPAKIPPWDYTIFARPPLARDVEDTFQLVFDKIAGGRYGYNRWTVNGKSWPDTDPLVVQAGKRYRLALVNASGDMHGIHLHRHTFEVTNWVDKPTSGLMKDVLALPGRKTATIEFVANNPGASLMHCHMQDHQDFGFMWLVKYA